MFTKSIIAASVAGLAAAAPAPAARQNANVLQLISINSGSPIQNANIHENGLRFWIGKDTATSCPSIQGFECPTGTQTAITIPSAGSVGMNVVVPGGQQVYVLENGEIGVTGPHSAAIPEGGVTTPFSYTAPSGAGGNVGKLEFNGSSFSACPSGTEGEYQIFANGVAKFTRTDCLGIIIGTAETQTEPVWEYS